MVKCFETVTEQRTQGAVVTNMKASLGIKRCLKNKKSGLPVNGVESVVCYVERVYGYSRRRVVGVIVGS